MERTCTYGFCEPCPHQSPKGPEFYIHAFGASLGGALHLKSVYFSLGKRR